MVLTALVQHGPALSQTSCVGRFGQAPIKRTVNSLCDMFCVRGTKEIWAGLSLMPPVHCPQTITPLAQHHISAVGQIQTFQRKVKEILWLEDC